MQHSMMAVGSMAKAQGVSQTQVVQVAPQKPSHRALSWGEQG